MQKTEHSKNAGRFRNYFEGEKMKRGYVDIEVYEQSDGWAQAKYLVHGWDDILWTNDLDSALLFLKESVEKMEREA